MAPYTITTDNVEELTEMLHAAELRSMLWALTEYLRNRIKHDEPRRRADVNVLREVNETIWKLADEHDVADLLPLP